MHEHSWTSRPAEQAALLNPPFLAFLIANCASEYRRRAEFDLPAVLGLVAVPMTLYNPVRRLLPSRTTTSLATWLERSPEARLMVQSIVTEFRPFVMHGLLVGVQGQLLELIPPFSVKSKGRLPQSLDFETDETAELRRASRLVGRWFAMAGNPETVLAMLGLRP